MTTVNPAIKAWAGRPIGKATRAAIALLGSAVGTLLLMTASVVTTGQWALILLGVGLAATSVRAAVAPTGTRLAIVAIVVITAPLLIQTI